MVECPECGSQRTWKDGKRYVEGGEIQRYLCRSCGYRFSNSKIKFNITAQILKRSNSGKDFSNPNILQTDVSLQPLSKKFTFKDRENVGSHDSSNVTITEKTLNRFRVYNRERRVCAQKDAKNLVKVESQTERREAGATNVTSDRKLTPQEIKGKLVEFAWFMKKEGFRPSTIQGRVDNIKNLINRGAGANLLDTEFIKGFIAKQHKKLAKDEEWSDDYRANVVLAYTTFLAMHQISWNPPRYKRRESLPFIPLESELEQLIMSAGKRMSTFLHALKETAADPGEMHALEWTDINPQCRTITINHPVKGHKPRIITVSRQLIERLNNNLPKTSQRVFQAKMRTLRKSLQNQRKTAARKFNNPRLLKIKFTTFRHWKATMEYHKTKDILWVMKLLGHNSLRTTLIYIDLENALFNETNDAFIVKTAENLEEACKLLEVGFEYITDMNGKKLFRKRK